MKTILLACLAVAAGMSFAVAQDFYAPLPYTDPDDTYRDPGKPEFFEEKQPADGILVRVLRTLNPARLFDLRAPKEFGSGEDTVSRDPADPEQKPKGFIFLSFNW